MCEIWVVLGALHGAKLLCSNWELSALILGVPRQGAAPGSSGRGHSVPASAGAQEEGTWGALGGEGWV